MSDIVERLRANTHKYPGFENMNTDAAAEIERLRARVAELESINWIVRHVQSHAIVAAFQHWDIARGYIDRCQYWKPHELVLEQAARAANGDGRIT